MAAPTREEIFQWLEERRSLLRPLHNEMSIDQDYDSWSSRYQSYVAKKYITGLPKNFPVKTPPIAQMGVDIGLNNIFVGDTPSVKTVMARSSYRGDEYKEAMAEDASYLTECAVGLLMATDLYSIESPYRDFVRKALALGAGFLHYCIDYQVWGEPPFGKDKDGQPVEGKDAKEREVLRRWQDRRMRNVPFSIQSIHPKVVFFDPHHDPPRDYIREDWISLTEAKREHPHVDQYAVKNVRSSGRNQTVVRRVMYFSDDYLGCWLDTQAVYTAKDGAKDGVMPNPTGQAGHRMALGGFGDKDDVGSWDVRIKGIIRDARDIVLMKITNLNIKEAMKLTTGFPPLDFEGTTKQQAEDESEGFEYGPGAKWTHSKNVVGKPFNVPQVPQVLYQEDEEVDRLLEMKFGPEILRGIYRDDTATGQATRVSIAQAPYRAAKYACQQAAAAMLHDLIYMIKYEIREPVWVPGPSGPMKIDPEKLPAARFHFEVDFSPPTEEEKAFRRKNVMEDYDAGALMQYELIEELRPGIDGKEKVIEIRADRMVEAVLQSPQIMALIEQRFMEERDLGPPEAAPIEGMAAPIAPPEPVAAGVTGGPMPPTLGSAGYFEDQAEKMLGAPLIPGSPSGNGNGRY